MSAPVNVCITEKQGQGCGGLFPQKTQIGLCSKCLALKNLEEKGDVREYERLMKSPACMGCGLAFRFLSKGQFCGTCHNLNLNNYPAPDEADNNDGITSNEPELGSIGVFAEVSAGGHDKEISSVLRICSLSFSIYGFRDRFSGMVLHMAVVPNHRLATTVGHVYLDFIEKYQTIPLQLTIDRVPEAAEMYAMHSVLRHDFAPDIDEEVFPAVKNTNNIIIKSCWRWLLKLNERNFIFEVKRGYDDGIFNPDIELHLNLAYWIWSQVLQKLVDEFIEYFNNHRTRKQKDKLTPSGTTPRNIFMNPGSYNAGYYGVKITQEAINGLRTYIAVTREQAFQFVDDDFARHAKDVWTIIQSPRLTLQSGWKVFSDMLRIFELVENA